MTKKTKHFYDDYDELFLEPTVKPLQKNLKQVKIKSDISKKRRVLITGSIILGLLLIASFSFLLMGRTGQTGIQDVTEVTEYPRPLQEAGVKATGEKDFSLPLAATFEKGIFTLNRGYQLEIKGDCDIELADTSMSVLPSDSDFPLSKRIADISFYDKRDYAGSGDLEFSEDLVATFAVYGDFNQRSNFFKTFQEESIGDVQAGYVLEYERDAFGDNVKISKYYLFPDGTGIKIERYRDYNDEDEKRIKSDISLQQLTTAYPNSMKSLAENVIFSQN